MAWFNFWKDDSVSCMEKRFFRKSELEAKREMTELRVLVTCSKVTVMRMTEHEQIQEIF